MKARYYNSRATVETLDDRTLMSTVAQADFNNDGLVDKAEVTNPTTITVSLAKSDGTYTVSAILTAPKTLPVGAINISDYNGDGKPDISSGGLLKNRFYGHLWLGNADGTFGDRITDKANPIPKGWV